jgi:hypothetical protein
LATSAQKDQSKINVVSNYDTAHGYTKAAAAADAAWNRTAQATAAATAPNSNIAPSPFNGAQWAGSVVTWSFAGNSGPKTAPFSNYVQSQYQTAVAQAFQTWANAAGITLEQVSDSSSADIRVGWGVFDPSNSGVLGYTSYSSIGGIARPGVTIRLEDPAEDPLLTGSNGFLTYSGTTTTLNQLALHEIGHALGLAESSDPNSIMFPELGSQNATLDATDFENIQMEYQSASNSGLGTAALMAHAIASFTAASSSTSALIASAGPQTSTSVLASPLH